jgi:hypothetical protein
MVHLIEGLAYERYERETLFKQGFPRFFMNFERKKEYNFLESKDPNQ